MHTFVASIIVERCLVNNFEFNPGHAVNQLLLMDLVKGDCEGLKQAACIYEARSVFVSLFNIITEIECSDIGCNAVKFWSLLGVGTIYSFFTGNAISHKPSVKFLYTFKIKYSFSV